MKIPDIVLVGPIWDISGVAETNRNLFKALVEIGVKVKLIELPGWSHLKADLSPETRDLIEQGFARNDIQSPAAIHAYPPDPFKGSVNVNGAALQVSYTVFETDKCPLLWRDMLNSDQFIENWVPCDFQKNAYVSQGVRPEKMNVIAHGVDVDRFKPGLEPINYEIPEENFVIATAMDWGLRKNPEAIVNAFLQEFKGVKDATLLLKAYTGYGIDDGSKNMIRQKITSLRQINQSDADIRLVTDFLHADEMPHFHSSSDAWINLSRGEGWDMGSLQSMACGKPVILADNTSHKVYGTPENSYQIPCKTVPVNNKEFLAKNPQFIDHSWYEVNLKETKKAMRQAYSDYKDGSIVEKNKAARQTACDLSWKKTATKIVFHLGKYYK